MIISWVKSGGQVQVGSKLKEHWFFSSRCDRVVFFSGFGSKILARARPYIDRIKSSWGSSGDLVRFVWSGGHHQNGNQLQGQESTGTLYSGRLAGENMELARYS